jgi:hypothetical protein
MEGCFELTILKVSNSRFRVSSSFLSEATSPVPLPDRILLKNDLILLNMVLSDILILQSNTSEELPYFLKILTTDQHKRLSTQSSPPDQTTLEPDIRFPGSLKTILTIIGVNPKKFNKYLGAFTII